MIHTDTHITETSFKESLQGFIRNILKWISTILILVLHNISHHKLHSAINMASEEFFQCHLNIISSVDGHVFVGHETYLKQQKYSDLENQLYKYKYFKRNSQEYSHQIMIITI